MSARGIGRSAEPLDRLQKLERENGQLRRALLSRIVIEQAKGVLAERFQLDLKQALELLRRAARSNRMSSHSLAEAVTTEVATPPEIEEILCQLARPKLQAVGRMRRAEVAG